MPFEAGVFAFGDCFNEFSSPPVEKTIYLSKLIDVIRK